MKLFLHFSDDSNTELIDECVSILKQAGVLVVTNVDEAQGADFSEKELKRLKMTGENMLDKMDAYIIEASFPDPQIGYLLAYAMSQKKPALYLVKKGTKVGPQLKRLPDHIMIHEYEPEEIKEELVKFMRDLEKGFGEAVANIKFTLRITPQIERYLSWKAKRKKISKADYLRERISEDMIPSDEEYKKYLNRK
ncbi:MAG: hypothetical protein WC495_00380 [Patescibacteria group bacterium]|jgi:hypothetical protein